MGAKPLRSGESLPVSTTKIPKDSPKKQKKSHEALKKEYDAKAEALFKRYDNYFKKRVEKDKKGNARITYESDDTDLPYLTKTEKGIIINQMPAIISNAWGKILFNNEGFKPLAITQLQKFLRAVAERSDSWEDKRQAEKLADTPLKQSRGTEKAPEKRTTKLPKMESFRDNWAPGGHLVKVLKRRGLDVKHASADRTNGLTGMIRINNPDAGSKSVIVQLNNAEIIKGYKVILKQNENNERIINYEFKKIS